jgi:hypothetical protein
MRTSHRYIALATLSAALASLIAYAGGQTARQQIEIVERNSPDLMPSADERRLSLTASKVTPAMSGAAKAGPTEEEVGDVDSFGRNVKWLGVTQMNVFLTPDCSGFPEGVGCAELDANGSASFSFEDLARIELPKKAANSLLCYWLSPFLTINYQNTQAFPVTARLQYSPTLTVENPVLDDPALINAMTGLPFGGSLLTSMTSSEFFEVLLDPGQGLNERKRDSTVCIAGFVTQRNLVANFGLTEAQAKEFFKQPTTVRMNISGTAQYIGNANMGFGFRIVGD